MKSKRDNSLLIIFFAFLALFTPNFVSAKSLLVDQPDRFIPSEYRFEKSLPPEACFKITNNLYTKDRTSGTTATIFYFNAYCSTDPETPDDLLEVRYDFENDGKMDTYFSRRKNTTHTFKTPGYKTIKLEVLDREGNVSSSTKRILVVQDEPPMPHFTVKPDIGTENTVFRFSTNTTEDSQYPYGDLKFRFDFDGDGHYDTEFEKTSNWKHIYRESGLKNVTLEVCDPEDLCSRYSKMIYIRKNKAPEAHFSIQDITQGSESDSKILLFDAGNSSDPDNQQINYNWDFNYTGYNDIQSDTVSMFSSKIRHIYYKKGRFQIKLTVTDEGGLSDTFYREIVIF